MSFARSDHDLSLKFALIGDAKTGKSTLFKKFISNKFVKGSLYQPTISVEFENKTIQIEENKRIKLQVWDSSGQERFESDVMRCCLDAQTVFLVYDVTNRNSLDNLEFWQKKVKQQCKDCAFVLVGTKAHIKDESRVVTPEVVQEKAKHLGIDPRFCFEVSAETGEKVEEMFATVAKKELPSQPEVAARNSLSMPLLVKPRQSFFQRHKAEIIGGIAAAIIFTAIIVPLAVVFWPVIAAIVPVAAGVAIGAALGVPAATAVTALIATAFGIISAAVVAGLAFCVGKYGFGKKKTASPLLPDCSAPLQVDGSTKRITAATGSSPAKKVHAVKQVSSDNHDVDDRPAPAPSDKAPTSTSRKMMQ